MISYIKKDLKSLFNIGDSLCTPDVYFDIESEKDIRIIGGGVWNIQKYASDKESKKTVLWGAGLSIKGTERMIDDLNFTYLEWSSRDRDLLVDKSKFVPCVSCFHKDIIRESESSKTMIFTNANKDVSTKIDILETEDVYVITNDISYTNFIEKWKYCDRIITNSYHGIYWGLLSGREVIPFGYSSKFKSVLRLFDLELPDSQMYDIKSKFLLKKMIESKDKKFFRLQNSKKFLSDFISINLEFADKLKSHGIICKIKQ